MDVESGLWPTDLLGLSIPSPSCCIELRILTIQLVVREVQQSSSVAHIQDAAVDAEVEIWKTITKV